MRSLLLLALVLAEAFPGQIQPSVARRHDDTEEVVHIKVRPSTTITKKIYVDTEELRPSTTITKKIYVDAEELRPSRTHDTIKTVLVDTEGLRPSRNSHDTIKTVLVDTSKLHTSHASHPPSRGLHDTDASVLYDIIVEVLQNTDSSGLRNAITKALRDFMAGRYSSRSGGRYSLSLRGRGRSGVRVADYQNGYCGTGWTYYNLTNSCYRVFFDENWSGAESICVLLGGHLTSIHTPEENLFVADLSKANIKRSHWTKGTWIGLHQASYPSSTEWTWTDGTKVDYSPFAPGEPNNTGRREQCAELYSDEPHLRQWNDWRCDTKMRNFVCKKESFPLL